MLKDRSPVLFRCFFIFARWSICITNFIEINSILISQSNAVRSLILLGLNQLDLTTHKTNGMKSLFYISIYRGLSNRSVFFLLIDSLTLSRNAPQHFWCLNLVIFGSRRVMSKYRFGLRIIIVFMNSLTYSHRINGFIWTREYQFYGDGQRDKKVKKRRFTINSFYEISLYQNDYLFTVTSQFCPPGAIISKEKKRITVTYIVEGEQKLKRN